MAKTQSGFRLTDTARELLKEIAAGMGLSMTAAIETIIREVAKKRGIGSPLGVYEPGKSVPESPAVRSVDVERVAALQSVHIAEDARFPYLT